MLHPTHIVFCNANYLYLATYDVETQNYTPHVVKADSEAYQRLWNWVNQGGIGEITVKLSDEVTVHLVNSYTRRLRIAQAEFSTMSDTQRLGRSQGKITDA